MPIQLKDSAFLKTARERFKLADEADTDQATRERDDLAFYAGEQWPDDVMQSRQGMTAQNGLPAIPARPTLVINKVREPIRQVQNEIRESDIGVELTPADDFGDLGITPDDTEVMLREGLVRRIIRDSKGQDAWNWAGDRADIAGRGYFAVMTRYLPGKTQDQEIYLDRIYNQASVKGDPARTEPDGSDASFWFWGTWMLSDRFVAQYPKDADGKNNPLKQATANDFISLIERYPNWYRAEGSGKDKEKRLYSVRVENYVYTVYDSKDLVTLSNEQLYWADELPDPLPEGVKEVDRRTVLNKTIKFAVIAGGCVELEHTDLASPDMPIIETLGEELHPFDEQRRVEGMVRNARSAQQGFNYMVSKQVEQIGLTPIPPLMVDPLAIDGYEAWYKVYNTRALPYLPHRTYDDEGRQLAEPHRPPVDPNILPIAQSIALFDMSIKSTTAVPDPTLGNVDPSLKSGRAIRETVANAKGSTSNFVSNRVRSIRRACEVINGLLYPIYGSRPGRLVRVLTGEGQQESMIVGDPQQLQQQGQPGPPPQADPQATQRQQNAKAAKSAKLTKDASFNIAVKITKNFDTRRQQEASQLGELISAEPQLMTWFGDLYLGSSDLPGRKGLAERAKVMLAPPIQQMLAQKEQGEELPPAAQAKIAAMQEQIQKAEQAIQELSGIAEGKQLEAQTKKEIEQMKADSDLKKAEVEGQRDVALEELRMKADLEKARMDNATKIHVAEIQAKTKGVIQAQEMEHEAIALAHTQQHETEQAALDRDNVQRTAASKMAHEAATADGQQEFAADQAAQDRELQASQQESV